MTVVHIIIAAWLAGFVLSFAWLWWERSKPISDMDRRLDRIDRELDERKPPVGSLQARLDEERARDALRTQRTVHAEPMPHRRNGGGWVA